ncbi:hypothetical protein EJP617_03610 [Erwinia sp. Ejp617]|nr:hypothetical protein EJP617_03610 [Erwinia sp. Ejp617]
MLSTPAPALAHRVLTRQDINKGHFYNEMLQWALFLPLFTRQLLAGRLNELNHHLPPLTSWNKNKPDK